MNDKTIKIDINNNNNKENESINNLGHSTVSFTDSNDLMISELNEIKDKEYDEPGTLCELLTKYNLSPNNNNLNLNNHPSLQKIFQNRELHFELELYQKYNYYQTIAYFKSGDCSNNINKYIKCRLIIKQDGYIYALNLYNNEKNIFVNPENSFIFKLEEDNNISEKDKQNIKYDYDLSKPLLCLNLHLLTCILLINKINVNEFTILILGTSKKYSFIIKDKNIKEKFCYIIGNQIFYSDGHKDNKLGLILNDKYFFSRTYITPEDFECIAKTGDLLLFKTRHILSDIQRLFTCDTYDHIGFIHSNYGVILIFDASKQGTCQAHYWGSFKATSNYIAFEKICYRRLNIEEKNYDKRIKIQEKIENITEKFMNEISKKRYYLSFCDLLFKRKPKNYEINNDWEKAEGFSCSSLVAALYYKLGIIKLNSSVHSIKPGDFQQNRNLNFLPGFSLGPEKIIEFSS